MFRSGLQREILEEALREREERFLDRKKKGGMVQFAGSFLL